MKFEFKAYVRYTYALSVLKSRAYFLDVITLTGSIKLEFLCVVLLIWIAFQVDDRTLKEEK